MTSPVATNDDRRAGFKRMRTEMQDEEDRATNTKRPRLADADITAAENKLSEISHADATMTSADTKEKIDFLLCTVGKILVEHRQLSDENHQLRDDLERLKRKQNAICRRLICVGKLGMVNVEGEE
jgi:hypothetical protein